MPRRADQEAADDDFSFLPKEKSPGGEEVFRPQKRKSHTPKRNPWTPVRSAAVDCRARPRMLPLSLLNLAVIPGSRSLADRRCFCAAAAAAVVATPPQAVAASPTTAAIYDAEASTYDAAYADSLVSRAVGFDSLRRSVATRAHGDHAGATRGCFRRLPFSLSRRVQATCSSSASAPASTFPSTSQRASAP